MTSSHLAPTLHPPGQLHPPQTHSDADLDDDLLAGSDQTPREIARINRTHAFLRLRLVGIDLLGDFAQTWKTRRRGGEGEREERKGEEGKLPSCRKGLKPKRALTDRHKDRQRQAGRHAERRAGRQADRQTGRQTDRQAGRHTDRHKRVTFVGILQVGLVAEPRVDHRHQRL